MGSEFALVSTVSDGRPTKGTTMAESSLRDAPIERPDDGHLGMKVYADVLHDFLLGTDSPVAIGIQGESGSGRTSLMNLIKWNLGYSGGNASATPNVSFNPWQFSLVNDRGPVGPELMSAIIGRIRDMPDEDGGGGGGNFEAEGRPNTLNQGLPAVVPQSQTPFEGMPAAEEMSSDAGAYRDQFRSLVDDVRRQKGANRLVIFLDDVDRLEPERAFEMLENLATFLKVRGCSFVLSVSYDVVQSGMNRKFGDDLRRRKGKEFYDKVIDVPFNMPTRTYELGNYITELLNESGFITYQVAPEEQSFYEEITTYSVGRNPRNIKRVIKKAQVIDKMRSKVKQKIGGQKSMRDKRMLYALTCMQIAWPELFTYLAEHRKARDLENFDTEKFLAKRREGRKILERVEDERQLVKDMKAYVQRVLQGEEGMVSAESIEPLLRMIRFA